MTTFMELLGAATRLGLTRQCTAGEGMHRSTPPSSVKSSAWAIGWRSVVRGALTDCLAKAEGTCQLDRRQKESRDASPSTRLSLHQLHRRNEMEQLVARVEAKAYRKQNKPHTLLSGNWLPFPRKCCTNGLSNFPDVDFKLFARNGLRLLPALDRNMFARRCALDDNFLLFKQLFWVCTSFFSG